jgi:sigma-B regulation protein RsbU (phosphoserine phosphatase)
MPSPSPRRLLRYAFYDWTSGMPKSKRLLTWAGILIQGYAIYAGMTGSLAWPLQWPRGRILYLIVWIIYLLGSCIINWSLTTEFFRKRQLESEQIAARQIQQTLQPENVAPLPGYDLQTYYQPFRDIGGDYFDVIELTAGRTLFAIADVSGKGMAAALLAANIQALVRSIANVTANPLEFAGRINQHLNRYTPSDRFATAVFGVLDHDSGELTYVNAGHNPPIISASGTTSLLKATGVPLGLLSEAEYAAGTANIPARGVLLLYTDGLTDSIAGDDPEKRVRESLAGDSSETMQNLKALVDARLSQDDVTILVVRRASEPE